MIGQVDFVLKKIALLQHKRRFETESYKKFNKEFYLWQNLQQLLHKSGVI